MKKLYAHCKTERRIVDLSDNDCITFELAKGGEMDTLTVEFYCDSVTNEPYLSITGNPIVKLRDFRGRVTC